MKSLIKQITIVAFLGALTVSCKKTILDINTDPNNPTTSSATAEQILPAALTNTGGIYNNPSYDDYFVFAGLWMGHLTYGAYAIQTEFVSYNITNTFAQGTFGSLYDNLEDYHFVEEKGIEQNNNFYHAIGLLMQAYNFQTLVDLYNNVPYSEALTGTNAIKPKYDKGQDIYDVINLKIDSAITLFKISAPASVGGDVMFNGDPDKWLKLANTVKLRLLLRQSERSDRSGYIATEVAKLSGADFLDIDAGINPGYSNSLGKTNPFWGANIAISGVYYNDLYRGNQYTLQFLMDHNDPRLSQFFYPAQATGLYHGNYFGDQGEPFSETCDFGPGLLKDFGQPSILMLSAESYFLQAEAALRGWTSGDAQALYQAGVEESFRYLGLSLADAQDYYTQPGDNQVNWNAAAGFDEQLALIIRQKWIALLSINELEPYNDYRRLDLPADIPLSTSPYSTGVIPRRLLYPQREYEVNADNVAAEGNITPTGKIWWEP